MSDSDMLPGDTSLQFDRADLRSQGTVAERPSVTCAACGTSIQDEYYDVNGKAACSRCRVQLEAAAETPSGIGPFAIGAAFGFFAAVAGAIVYYLLLAFAHLEIGIVTILIGYMVGYSIRKGARGGGLRFQILAVALTYAAVALAYTPLVISNAINGGNKNRGVHQAEKTDKDLPAPASHNDATATRATLNPSAALLLLLEFSAALPVLVIVRSLPSGLISAFIIFIGLRQAWRMTAAPFVQVLGPYRVGTGAATTPA